MVETLVADIQCASGQTDILNVETDCSQVYLDGSETNGGQVQITISSSNSILNSGINPQIKVWYPQDVAISSVDSVLNRIDYGCAPRWFQSTPLSVSAKYSTGVLTEPEFLADVTSRANVSCVIHLCTEIMSN